MNSQKRATPVIQLMACSCVRTRGMGAAARRVGNGLPDPDPMFECFPDYIGVEFAGSIASGERGKGWDGRREGRAVTTGVGIKARVPRILTVIASRAGRIGRA